MPAKIISAFPGCGKTTFWKKYSMYYKVNRNLEGKFYIGSKILDSDSSLFSWIYDDNGKTNERNPDFPNNYIKHIKDNIKNEDIIFISSHKVVRDALRENNIPYYLIYPTIDMKDEWIKRFIKRGNGHEFIDFQRTHYEEFIKEMEQETFPKHIKLSKPNMGIDKDIIEYILSI